MKIAAYSLYRLSLGCLRPFKIASGISQTCDTLLLELRTDSGHKGYGEAVPIPLLTDETLVGCQWTLQDQLLPLLRGRDPRCIRDIHAEMLTLTRSKSARCAVDLALYQLMAQALRVPLSRLLGTGKSRFETNYSIGICDLQETVDLALEFQELGYTSIKLKVGVDPDEDVRRVVKLNQVLQPHVTLRLDANGGWTRQQALSVLEQCKRHDCRIEFVEQPVEREDFDGLKQVRERSHYRIAADESVQGLDDALRLLQGQCVDILNLKLMKTGGLFPALEIVSLARAFRCDLMVGGMVGETEIGVTAAAALAAAADFEFADLDADILLKDGPFQSSPPGQGHLGLAVPYRTWQADEPVVFGDLVPSAALVDHWEL